MSTPSRYWLAIPGEEPTGPHSVAELLALQPLPDGATLCRNGSEKWRPAAEILRGVSNPKPSSDAPRQVAIIGLVAVLLFLLFLLAKQPNASALATGALTAFGGSWLIIGILVLGLLTLLLPLFVYQAASEAKRCRQIMEQVLEELRRR
jgi:hypothetical protein